jgi:thymidylate synthase ThyX
MKAELIAKKGSWRQVADCANVTIHKEAGEGEPSSKWKKRMLLCEHSPIRELSFDIRWTDLRYWVSVHLVRHKIGIEHYVRSQRSDRTGVDRDTLPQDSPVEHRVCVNAQALIFISRKRLCSCASAETREAWAALLDTLRGTEPEIYSACVPDCVYRGRCYEFKSCGFDKTEEFQRRLEEYGRVDLASGPALLPRLPRSAP